MVTTKDRGLPKQANTLGVYKSIPQSCESKEKNEIKMGESHSLSESMEYRVNKKEKQYSCKHTKISKLYEILLTS